MQTLAHRQSLTTSFSSAAAEKWDNSREQNLVFLKSTPLVETHTPEARGPSSREQASVKRRDMFPEFRERAPPAYLVVRVSIRRGRNLPQIQVCAYAQIALCARLASRAGAECVFRGSGGRRPGNSLRRVRVAAVREQPCGLRRRTGSRCASARRAAARRSSPPRFSEKDLRAAS